MRIRNVVDGARQFIDGYSDSQTRGTSRAHFFSHRRHLQVIKGRACDVQRVSGRSTSGVWSNSSPSASGYSRHSSISRKGHTMIGLVSGVASFILGIVVLWGWLMDYNEIISISPDWVSMKPVTAIGFFLSGVVLMFSYLHKVRWADLIVSGASFILIHISIATFLGSYYGMPDGISQIFINSFNDNHMSVAQGIPSLATLLSFLLVGISGIMRLFEWVTPVRCAGIVVLLISCIAIIGYGAGMPSLYFYKENVSTAMAFHAALGFFVLSSGLIFIDDRKWGHGNHGKKTS